MVILPADASDETILALVRQWVNFIASDRMESAQDLLDTNDVEREWSPSLIRELLSRYEPPRVTCVEAAQVGDLVPRHTVDRWASDTDSTRIGTVEFDLPLDGFWSDLTAIFWVKFHPEGLVLELYDIHVM